MNLNMMPLTATMGSVTGGSPSQPSCSSRTGTPTGVVSLKGTMISEIPSITVTTSPNPNSAPGTATQRSSLKSSTADNPHNSQQQNSPVRQLGSIDEKSHLNSERNNCF